MRTRASAKADRDDAPAVAPPPATGVRALQRALGNRAFGRLAGSGSMPAGGPAPAALRRLARTPAPAKPDPAVTKARADAIKVRDLIRGVAKVRAGKARSVSTSSRFYKRLADFYLADYLAAPSAAKGADAAENRIGKTFAGPATAGDAWEEGALATWNKQPIPDFARAQRPLLPPEIAAGTDILSRPNRKQLPFLDVPQLVGEANMGTGTDADVAGGGKNISQLMHWATGVKYSQIDRLTMRELFFAYENWHLEAWDVFGEDPINDLIAEEAGRILGTRLRAGAITRANLQAELDAGFAEARAWVGTLLRARRSALDDWIVAEAQQPANIWWGAVAPMKVWGDTTIFGLLRGGASVDAVAKSKLVNRITEIYTLIFEADSWEAAHGAIDNGFFIPLALRGLFDRQFEQMAKGQPVTSGP